MPSYAAAAPAAREVVVVVDGSRPASPTAIDSASQQRFETASATTRCFLGLGRLLETKKQCLLILVVSLGFVLQVINMLLPPGFLAKTEVQEILNGTSRVIDTGKHLLEATTNISNLLPGLRQALGAARNASG
jgi:hypothetical protein